MQTSGERRRPQATSVPPGAKNALNLLISHTVGIFTQTAFVRGIEPPIGHPVLAGPDRQLADLRHRLVRGSRDTNVTRQSITPSTMTST
jgi:hypothetical protein